jgi:hypothetical protein
VNAAPAQGRHPAPTAPAGFGGLLGATLSAWFGNLPLLAGIAAVAWLPYHAAQLALALALGVPHSTPLAGAIYLAAVVFSYVALLPLTQGALAHAVAARLGGARSSIGSAYAAAAVRYRSLLAAFLCLVLVLGATFTIALLVVYSLRAVLPPRYLLVLLVLASALPLFVAARFTVITQAVILEAAGGLEALRKSWSLLGGHYWTSLAMLVVLGALGFAVTSLVSIPARAVTATGDIPVLVTQILGAAVATILVAGLIQCAYTLLYFHARRPPGSR